MKKIKIFLASSIEDLKLDRLEIGNFFNELNDIYLNRGIYFSLIKCENYEKAMAQLGKQLQYDEEIRDSELVFFLFFTKVGDYTRHEFEVARQSFAKVNKPKIVTYFKTAEDSTEVGSEIKAFMKMLDAEFKHYYNTYGTIDTLKLGMLMQIKLMNLDNSVLEINDGEIMLDGKIIIDSRNIPMFDKDIGMIKLRQKLEEATDEFYKLREEVDKNPKDRVVYRKFSDVASQRAKFREELYQAEKNRLKFIEEMYKNINKGNLSQRQIEGYRLMEKGDVEGALEVLAVDEIMEEVHHNEEALLKIQEMESEIKVRLQRNVDELMQRAEVLQAGFVTSETAKEIRDVYEKIYCIVMRNELSQEVLIYYAFFLHGQRDYPKALELAEQLLKDRNYQEELRVYALLRLCGNAYKDMQRWGDAEEAYEKVIELQKSIVEKYPEGYWASLAPIYNDLGGLYEVTQRWEKAEKAHEKAIEIQRKLAEKDPERYGRNLAIFYKELGDLYKTTQRWKKAEGIYGKAVEIRKSLAEKNSKVSEMDFIYNYKGLGELYCASQRWEEAEEDYEKAVEILRNLAEKNPEAYGGGACKSLL